MSCPVRLVIQLPVTYSRRRVFFWACSNPVEGLFIMQNLFKQHKSSESDLNASRWLRAGIIKAAVKWRNSLRQFCKTMPGYRAFFVPAVSENLLCRICHLPVRRAVQVSVCGHRFCDSCLNGAFSNTRYATFCVLFLLIFVWFISVLLILRGQLLICHPLHKRNAEWNRLR